MLWIDNFLFNGEEVAFHRIKYLYDSVDKFYICEKRYTYQGSKKDKLYIDIMRKRFEPYLSKIEFAVEYSEPIGVLEDEANHRNFCASKILNDYPDDQFIVTVCDADEIPDIEIMKSVKEGVYNRCGEGCIYMEMDTFYYNLNWFFESDIPCRMPFIVNDILLKTNKNLQGFRYEKEGVFGVFECGWHFSYFMSAADIIRKIESSTHLEFNRSEFKSSEIIMDRMINGGDLFNREYVRITRNEENKSKYPKEILELNRAVMKAQFGV
jgi:beta-1,4-mannosyl-glycoprotein beta-1,4-N-acetylglucosaminyltransferase